MQHLPISAISAFTFLPRLRFNLFFWNACRMNAQRLAAASANRLSFVELVSVRHPLHFWLLAGSSSAFTGQVWLRMTKPRPQCIFREQKQEVELL